MSTAPIFNREIAKYLQTNNDEIANFIKDKFRESKRETYNGFFQDFLFHYGISSFSCDPDIYGDKYIPYLICAENNIFNEKSGRTDLKSKAYSLKDCEKIFAEYFISKFKFLQLQKFENWIYENNHQVL